MPNIDSKSNYAKNNCAEEPIINNVYKIDKMEIYGELYNLYYAKHYYGQR